MPIRHLLASVLLLALALRARPATANLGITGDFRAVGIAHAAFPITAMAVAPDGRLFAAIQDLGQTTGSTPGTAEIRVYSSYRTADGSVLDEGTTWATVDNVRATTIDEGLLGIALAPDFATSGLVYVYLTSTNDNVTQELRVYRENASATGDLLGIVRTGLEPPNEVPNRSGGGLTFGADGCLYVGIGDNGNNDRWNAQTRIGTNPFGGTESSELCTAVCTGTAELPDRTVANNDGQSNPAGKALRLAVEGASIAAAGPSNPVPTAPDVFSFGLRNPTAFMTHPLTGQLYATDRSDSQQAEVDILDRGGNQGWPCLEGAGISSSGVASCLSGLTADDVYANHPSWRRPIAAHTGNPTITGIAAYTGSAYPAAFYGDVFYLLRGNARIYRLDLDPPCFMPHPGGIVPTIVHDVTDPSQVGSDNGDFTVISDFNGDGTQDSLTFTNLTAIVQGPDPRGEQVLYFAGKQGGTGLTDDTVIFRLEYPHTDYTPYAGPIGHVADSCFTSGPYSGTAVGADPYGFENPFMRPTCLPPGGPCPGEPDGTDCSNADVCDGAEACQGGICQHTTASAADGTTCTGGNACLAEGTCQTGHCVPGGPMPDGTACGDGEPCNGLEQCVGGTCMPGSGPETLTVKGLQLLPEDAGDGSGALTLTGSILPLVPVAPTTADAFTVALTESGSAVYTGTLAAGDAGWHAGKPKGSFVYRGAAAGLTSVKLRTTHSGAVQVSVKGKHLDLNGPGGNGIGTRVLIGEQCFVAATICQSRGRSMRCR